VIEQAQVGAVQMTRVSLGIVGPVVPDVNVFNMPFVFRDQAHMRKVIDGESATRSSTRSPTPSSAWWPWPGWTAARATSTPRNRCAASKTSRA
jgi:TRAP-type C4-dicarboxylate transport system substrate-binding protein